MQKPIVVAVDDQPTILHAVAAALSELYHVKPFSSSQTALDYLKNQHADLVLLDVCMPVINGFDLASTIRSLEKHENTPIIFLTSSAVMESVMMAIESGGNDFMTKPFEHDILLSKIKRFLS